MPAASAQLDPAGLLAMAEVAVDGVEEVFCQGIGAQPARFKGEGDFATQVDLDIEGRLREMLTQLTGIGVFGEEFGGTEALLEGTAWVVDPIDGTANYSAGNPLSGILVALIHEGIPRVGVASFPLLGHRLAAAEGSRLRSAVARAAGSGAEEGAHIGCSSHLSPGLYGALCQAGLRPRMTGSVGLDSAFVAQGIFDGSLNFSAHPWDNAAGVVLAQAAGAVASDVDGLPWTVHSNGLVVGTPRVHATLLEAIRLHR